MTSEVGISVEQALRIDNELCEKYKIKRPSYDEQDLDDLKVCMEEKVKERAEWTDKWLDHETLIRFLKAFLTVEETICALEDYMNWRIAKDVDSISQLDVNDDEDLKRETDMNRTVLIPGATDRCGRPICLVNIRNHDRNHNNYPSLMKYVIHLQETMMRMADRISPDKKITIIFDLRGFTLRNMDFKYVKSYLHMVKSFYPERTAQCFIVNYPWVFLGCWSIVKVWMNDVTRSKFIFPGEEQLNEFIDLEKLPVQIFPKS